MLIHLVIENFAIIEKCSLDFSSGMTVITGETGAGKSIILDALSLVLGARAENSVIRLGAEKTQIQAVFDISSQPHIQQWLSEKELHIDNNECFLKRIVTTEGRSRHFINHNPVPLQLLRELGEMLVTLHGQHEHQALLNRESHRQWLDTFGHHEQLLQELQQYYQQYKIIEKLLAEHQTEITDRDSRVEFLQYQLTEFSELNIESLTPDKIIQYEKEFKSLSHAKDHIQTYQTIFNLLEDSLMPSLTKAKNLLPKDDLTFSNYFENAEIQLNQALYEIQPYTEPAELDPENISHLEKILDKIYHLSRKHHTKPEELPDLYQKLQQEFVHLHTLSSKIDELQNEMNTVKNQYITVCKTLSQSRKKAANKMASIIEKFCHSLSMEHIHFSVDLNPQNENFISPNGLEKIEFLVSLNPGQPLQPMIKIASGGELSRISLAINLTASPTQTPPVLIFDEVDVGISGATAMKVGKLLKQLSQKAQVICVTHLAQVASQGNRHLHIKKAADLKQNKTISHIDYLQASERVKEIARILGGETLTEKALLHAKELLEDIV